MLREHSSVENLAAMIPPIIWWKKQLQSKTKQLIRSSGSMMTKEKLLKRKSSLPNISHLKKSIAS
jgi:hypothetical protein